MAVKNLQTIETRVALCRGIRATGLDCNVSMQTSESQAQILSLPWHPLPGPMPTIRTERAFAADNAATARAVQRAGRSECGAGSLQRLGLARSAGRAVLSTRSTSLRSGYSYAMKSYGLTKRMTNRVRG